MPGRGREGQPCVRSGPGRAGSRHVIERRHRRSGRPDRSGHGEHQDAARGSRREARAHLQGHHLYYRSALSRAGLSQGRRIFEGRFSGLDRSSSSRRWRGRNGWWKSTPWPSSPRHHDILAHRALSRNRHVRDRHLVVVAGGSGAVRACSRQGRRGREPEHHRSRPRPDRPRSARPRPQCNRGS